MTTTTAPARKSCKYSAGDSVECLKTSFDKATWLHELWVVGTVVEVTVQNEARGLWNVLVQHDATCWTTQIVGPRGGNKTIRPVA